MLFYVIAAAMIAATLVLLLWPLMRHGRSQGRSRGVFALALGIAEHAALNQNLAVAVFSLEMSGDELIQRLLSSTAVVDAGRIRAGRLAPEDFDYLQIAHANANDLLHIVNQALEMTRLQSGAYVVEKDRVAVEPIIDSCLAMRQQQFADAEIVPIVEVSPDLPDVIADRSALSKCLLAVIDNAIKFSDGAPQVLDSADRVEDDVEIMIADRGVGIPEEYLDRVTEPFFQVDNSLAKTKSGSGLGLAITRSLLERQDARLRIMSHVGHGTTVHVRLRSA